MSWSYTCKLIKEDFYGCFETSSFIGKMVKVFFELEFQVLLLCRLIAVLKAHRQSKWLVTPLLYLQRVLSSCHISPDANIGRRVRFPHPTGIVIGADTQIGDNVRIFQHVTLGSHGRPGQEVGYPIIESDVTIFAGAMVIGSVHIGQSAIIGAGSLVLNDVPHRAIVAGVPAKILRFIANVEHDSGANNEE